MRNRLFSPRPVTPSWWSSWRITPFHPPPIDHVSHLLSSSQVFVDTSLQVHSIQNFSALHQVLCEYKHCGCPQALSHKRFMFGSSFESSFMVWLHFFIDLKVYCIQILSYVSAPLILSLFRSDMVIFFPVHPPPAANTVTVHLTTILNVVWVQLTDESERSDDDAPTVNGRVRPRATKQDALGRVSTALQNLSGTFYFHEIDQVFLQFLLWIFKIFLFLPRGMEILWSNSQVGANPEANFFVIDFKFMLFFQDQHTTNIWTLLFFICWFSVDFSHLFQLNFNLHAKMRV